MTNSGIGLFPTPESTAQERTSTIDLVRLTRYPSLIAVSLPKTTIPTFSFSRFKAIPFLYNRYGLLNSGGNDDLARMVTIIDLQSIGERSVEAALVDDGFHPNAILARYTPIRGLLHTPQGNILSQRTYQSYANQIDSLGTGQNFPAI
ncbi:hypothetical protein MIMGU_mgv11b019895mg [Erythranthe guttata]|uniref:Uncharacterized protein n=1 Tax=Erythranthe guttata TaxID=4155 RepID=A0A022QUY8_ERYGU|nr:hypothetical protein MIMGU_mgv11b019895mg [Erythranthe guttata]